MELQENQEIESVPANGDGHYGALLRVTDRDLKHREDFVEYVLHEAQPWHREFLTRLYDLWKQWNERYFESALKVPYLLLSETKSPAVEGDCSPVSGFGGKAQIRLRPSLLTGTHIRMREGEEFAEGRFRYVADVLLHEMIHQYQQEKTGDVEKPYHGHGPIFRDTCNRIGADLGVGPVRTNKKRGLNKDLPSSAEWPTVVRPIEYYLGAYIPPTKKPKDPLKAATAALMKAAVVYGDTNADEPESDAVHQCGAHVLAKALALRDVVRGVPPSGDTVPTPLDEDRKDLVQRTVSDVAEENEALEYDLSEAEEVMMEAVKSLLRGEKNEAYQALVRELYRLGMLKESDVPVLEQIALSKKADCKKAEEMLNAS